LTGYRTLSALLALTILVLGVAMIGVTLANGGGQVGLILGVLFIAAGAGRLYVQGRS
jgi:TRAP-type mannitol/chloroaromatic compound transport system permease large subunit